MNEEQVKKYAKRSAKNFLLGVGLMGLASVSSVVGVREFYPVEKPVKSEWVVEGEKLEMALESIKPRDLLNDLKVRAYKGMLERLEYSPIKVDSGNYRRDLKAYEEGMRTQAGLMVLSILGINFPIIYFIGKRDKIIRRRCKENEPAN